LTSPASETTDRRLTCAGLLLIGLYFYRLIRPTLRSGFSPDDCMNLYRSWVYSLPSLIKANLLFFLPSDFIRPMGEAWYRAIYWFANFNPRPFHLIYLAFMLANIFLVYVLARRLTSSRFASLVTALLFAYQPRWSALYFDTGYVFDVLCGFFLYAALLVYIRARQNGRNAHVAVVILLICALNSKEMAVALPALLLIYELIYEHRRRFTTIAITAVCVVAFIIGRTGALTSNPAYRPEFTPARFLATTAHFLNEIFEAQDWIGGLAAIALFIALLAIAVLLRSKPMLFAWTFIAVSALPIAFVPPRGGPQYYIPLFGCALYVASFLALIAERISALQKLSAPTRRAIAAAAMLLIAWPIYAHGKYVALRDVTSITEGAPIVMSLSKQLRESHPSFPHDARLFFFHEPIAPNVEDLLFIVRLTYRDRTLVVERASRAHWTPSPRQQQAYDAVFDYGPSGLITLPEPPLTLAPRIQHLFDQDWKPITADHRAHPGANIIAFATDLGPTNPEVPAGAQFPRDPFALGLIRLLVTVNGQHVPLVNQLGQPGEVNVYRVDFTLPKDLKPGIAQVAVTAAGTRSAIAELPVGQ
jgi:uncharacterized protein (TIGR03437 family)